MTIERAKEINAMLVKNALYAEGMVVLPGHPLDGISLQDMLEATHIITNQEPLQAVCDDRLIAALYVAYNYEPSEIDCIEPLAMTNSGKFVCVLQNGRG